MKSKVSKIAIHQSADGGTKIVPLLQDIRSLIDAAKSAVAVHVNAAFTCLYWQVGKRISVEVLDSHRAEYGQQILATVSQELTREYGQGFNYSALARIVKFTESFPDTKIVATLWQQLSWSHFKMLIPIEDPLRRDFYAEMCRIEKWSVQNAIC
jgi:hypothetical protein